MFKIFKYIVTVFAVSTLFTFIIIKTKGPSTPPLPLVAVANYGPHASLEEAIQGLKDGLTSQGFKEGENFSLKISDVNFDHALIPQMLMKLKADKPNVMVALSTPVAQALKNAEKEIPVVFSAITDPVDAGLVVEASASCANITGSSDQQDLNLFLKFAQKLLPNSKTVGLLYATGDTNDTALVNLMNKAAQKIGMKVMALPVDQTRDIPQRIKGFKGKVDFIYVGTSGPIQPALPTIVAEADRMGIPVFNADSDAVKKHHVLGSYGVSYYQVGLNTAYLVAELLRGKEISTLCPRYPSYKDHKGFISKNRAKSLGIPVESLSNATVIE